MVIALLLVGQVVVAQHGAGPAVFGMQRDDDTGGAGRDGVVVAVVTGGSKGIGLAVVRGLAGNGVRVVTGARSSSAELDELTRTGPVQAVEMDLTEPSGPARLATLAGQAGEAVAADVGEPQLGAELVQRESSWRTRSRPRAPMPG